ncbi:UDP-glycosyltransferase 87A2 [Acorus calamus]|uniref:Glycosyltransferase n=1 Tax=Acorus calamus TaxID=4465 RepID=A0AAV9CY35_ACOCL|nr:UDP-glycosyltransferase 87A2 [Acorus calamus]
MDPSKTNGQKSLSHVVAVPYPGRGHVNAMLSFSDDLAARGLTITVVATEEWLGLISAAASDSSPSPSAENPRFRSIPNVIPSEHVRYADFAGFIDAVFTKMESPFERLLDRLDPPPDAIIADTFLPWAVAVGNRRGIPVYSLWPMSPSTFSVFYHFDRLESDDSEGRADDDLIKCIPEIRAVRYGDLQWLMAIKSTLKRLLETFLWVPKAKALLLTTYYDLEPGIVDALRSILPISVHPIGPSIPHIKLHRSDSNYDDYFSWLDSQKDESVLYVSQGSFLSTSGPQLDELVAGVRMSGTAYIWVARGGDATRFEGGSHGLVVGWCEQLRVLCHRAVGGFMTHCGWNSVLEGLYAGVPMLTFPLACDQPLNRRLVAEVWGVGIDLLKEAKASEVVGERRWRRLSGG